MKGFAVLFVPCGGECTHGFAVERTHHGDDFGFARVFAGEFYGAFDGFCAAVRQKRLVQALRGYGGEFLEEFASFVVVEAGVAANELFRLRFDGGDDFWVAVPKQGDAVAAHAVHVFFAVYVPEGGSFAFGYDDLAFGEDVCHQAVFCVYDFLFIHG